VKFVYLGNERYSWCTEVHLSRTLGQMGHEVVFLQEDAQTCAGVRDAVTAIRPDVLIYQRTWGLPPDADGYSLHDAWAHCEQTGVTTVSYHLDLYLGLARGSDEELTSDPFWATKYVFTPDGDPRSEAEFYRLGIRHRYVRPGVVADECVPGTYRPKFDHDVVFVGSEAYHPEWPYRGELIGWLRDTYGDRFHRYGAGSQVVRGMPDLNDLYASAKIVVGDTLAPVHADGVRHKSYWSDRVYETLGRGGFLIHPYVEGMDEEFTDAEHLVFYPYGNFDALQAAIDYYLAHPAEREQIAKAGQAHVAANYTYHRRLREAFGQIGIAL
jgi:hypothetical protein